MCVELGADALKIPYTGDVGSFTRLVSVSDIPVLVLGGERLETDRDVLQLFADGLQAGCSGCLLGRNVTISPTPELLMRQLIKIAHAGFIVEEAVNLQKE
jgi:class I fructose-bisphosphate aldolase